MMAPLRSRLSVPALVIILMTLTTVFDQALILGPVLFSSMGLEVIVLRRGPKAILSGQETSLKIFPMPA